MDLSGLNVIVAGAATAGCSAALFLARGGAEVTLVERIAEPTAIGAGIAIAENGIAVLDSLGLGPALAAGRPVLISDQTPWRHLAEQHAGWDLPLANEKAFVEVLQEAAGMDDETFQQWSIGAWQYAKNFTESSNLKEKYKELFS